MIILHSTHSADSIAFVEQFGEGNTIIDWYSDNQAQLAYKISGLPQPSGFPFIVDENSRRGFENPISIEWVKNEVFIEEPKIHSQLNILMTLESMGKADAIIAEMTEKEKMLFTSATELVEGSMEFSLVSTFIERVVNLGILTVEQVNQIMGNA